MLLLFLGEKNMRILELKNFTYDEIYSLLYFIEKQGFDTIELNNEIDDLKRLKCILDSINIKIIVEVNKTHYLHINKLLDLNIDTIKVKNRSIYTYILKLIYKKLSILSNKDYINIINNSNQVFDKIAYISNGASYKKLKKEELIIYKKLLNNLYPSLTNSYDKTLYSPIIIDGEIDMDFLYDDKIKECNKKINK